MLVEIGTLLRNKKSKQIYKVLNCYEATTSILKSDHSIEKRPLGYMIYRLRNVKNLGEDNLRGIVDYAEIDLIGMYETID